MEIPDEPVDHEYFDFHELKAPMAHKVTTRTAFGAHRGLIPCLGHDLEWMRELLKPQEELDFYV